MLWPQIRKRIHGLYIRSWFALLFVWFVITIHFELGIDGVVRALHELLITLVAFQNRDAKVFAVRSHLGDIRGHHWRLDDQINVTGSLQDDCAVSRPVFFSYSGGREGSVFELDIDFAAN